MLLINPWESDVFPPPSLGYIQASVKTLPDVDVVAKDLRFALNDNSEYDLVAVSFHSFSVKYARMIREKFKDVRLVCGGHHPSALPDQMLSIGYDQVCIGEGEIAIQEIIKGDSSPIINGKSMKIDSIPFPNYEGFTGNWSMGLPIISSRGCPFKCSFCSSSEFWGRKWKMRSAENVVEEIISRNVKQFMFEDDNFTVNRKRAFDICDAIAPYNFSWQCATRAETLVDEELVIKLKNSGCKVVWLGIESFSQETLDRCNKHTAVEKMMSGIAMAEKHGIETVSQFIVGLPGDRIENIEETARNVKRSRVRRKAVNIMWLLPNTEAYTKAKEKGFDENIYLISGAPFYTYEQNYDTLSKWANLINSI